MLEQQRPNATNRNRNRSTKFAILQTNREQKEGRTRTATRRIWPRQLPPAARMSQLNKWTDELKGKCQRENRSNQMGRTNTTGPIRRTDSNWIPRSFVLWSIFTAKNPLKIWTSNFSGRQSRWIYCTQGGDAIAGSEKGIEWCFSTQNGIAAY